MVTKTKDDGTTLITKDKSIIKPEYLKQKEFKIYAHFNTYRNEIFFARFVVLVEGDSDKILWTTLLESKWGINLNLNGVSIIECGGKGGVIYFVGVMRLMGIKDFVAIWDKDSGKDPDKFGQLKHAIDNSCGLEIAPKLESFLTERFPEVQFRDDHKIEDAYNWASSVAPDKIPTELVFVKNIITEKMKLEY